MNIYKLNHWGVLTGLLLLLPGMTSAADLGIYAGLGLGYAVLDEVAPDDDKADTGAKVYFGMRIVGPLGIEVAYYDLGKYSNETEEVSGMSAAAVGNLDIRGMTLFAKAGLVDWTVKDVASSTELSDMDATYGVGLNLPVDKRVLVRMEWERFAKIGKDDTTNAPGKDMSLLSFGVSFMF